MTCIPSLETSRGESSITPTLRFLVELVDLAAFFDFTRYSSTPARRYPKLLFPVPSRALGLEILAVGWAIGLVSRLSEGIPWTIDAVV